MTTHSWLLLVLTVLITISQCQKCGKDDTQVIVSFHPHLDAFWLNSQAQLRDISFIPMGFLYNMNQRNSKQIFNSMYDSLTAVNTTAERRYFVSEVFFIKDWYDYVDETKRAKFRELLTSGKLQMVNLGWVENDEAICYYDDIIEQYTVGMNYFYEEFNYIGKVGWATDCFGHSHSQAALLNQLGLEMQGIERFDERYTHLRKDGPLLEFYWVTKSDSNNITYGGILTHLRYFNHEPADYLRRQNSISVANEFNQVLPIMKTLYKKNLLFRFFGNDFEQFVPKEFEVVEDAMKSLNSKSKCQAYHYGNPSEYMNRLKEYYQENTLQQRYYDLMPDWDAGRYWTGYYTTDPVLKKVCKDSSRLLNFYKKAIVHSYSAGKITNLTDVYKKLVPMEELLAIMQHHDGITATSKHHIEVDMMKKMNKTNLEIVEQFKNLSGASKSFYCDIFANNNECTIDQSISTNFELTLHNFGTARRERVEVKLPNGKYFRVLGDTYWELYCFKQGYLDCRIVLDIHLNALTTTILFGKIDTDMIKPYVIVPTDIKNTTGQYGSAQFKVSSPTYSTIKYEFANNYFIVGYYSSNANGINRSYNNWTKFGGTISATESVRSGFYIMANDGNLASLGVITSLKTMLGDKFAKILVDYNSNLQAIITLQKDSPHILDIVTSFQPGSSALSDYFLRVQSNINGNNEFYHDANGYLVMKRVFDERPDYEFKPVEGDKINANTYPTTTFAYIKNADSKMLVSLDRAEGVAIYEKDSLLMNIDRITVDDGKGAMEAYSYIIRNIFRHRVAIVKATDDLERQWQKQYDEPILGTYAVSQLTSQQTASVQKENQLSKYLKLTTAILNNHTIVIRLQNMAEFTSLDVQLTNAGKITLPEFKLNLTYKDIKESFHNGIPLGQRQRWTNIKDAHVVDIHANIMNNGKITLQPLQIRSFRVDFTDMIKMPAAFTSTSIAGLSHIDVANIPKKAQKHLRCF